LYETLLSLPDSGIVPALGLEEPGADAKLPDVLPPAVKITAVGVPAPAALLAKTRYWYCVPEVNEETAKGDVADADTVVHVAPSTELCTVYPVIDPEPMSVGADHAIEAPPLVGVATSDETRPGTPPTAMIERRCSDSEAATDNTPAASRDSEETSGSDASELRRPASVENGLTDTMSEAVPRPNEVRALTRTRYS
jgi:hypothetical protein